jgi:type III pantothenate kinase
MQGLITLDLGNTNPHAGLFQRKNNAWELIKVVPLENLVLSLSELQMNSYNSSVVVSQVRPRELELKQLFEAGFLITFVKDYWRGKKFAGMPVNYSQSLGEDRLIEAFYIFKKFNKPHLIIDAGTFVTLDVVDENGFSGGYIVPGIKAYFDCYKTGYQLSNVGLDVPVSYSLPTQTKDAIEKSYFAFVELARKMVKDFEIKNISITGSQSQYWSKLLTFDQASPLVEINPHLIHWSLHYWMTTQIEPL